MPRVKFSEKGATRRDQDDRSSSQLATFREWVVDTALSCLQSASPLRDTSPSFLWIFGLFSVIIQLAIFVGFLAYYTETSLASNSYISTTLTQNSGQYCSYVPTPISGTFLATDNGLWLGSSAAQAANVIYRFVFNNIAVTQDKSSSLVQHFPYTAKAPMSYYDLISSVLKQGLEPILNIATTQNSAINLVLWTSYRYDFSYQGYAQQFMLEGSPSAIFYMEYSFAYFASNKSVCSVPCPVSFDKSSATINIDFPLTPFKANCSEIFDLTQFELQLMPPGDEVPTISASIDMNTFMTALALNLGFLELRQMQLVPLAAGISRYLPSFAFANDIYSFVELYDPRYPQMLTLLCANRTTNFFADTRGPRILCTLPFGENFFYGLPLFNPGSTQSMFSGDIKPGYCNCSSITAEELSNCNDYYHGFLVSYIFVPFYFNSNVTYYEEYITVLYTKYLQMVMEAGNYNKFNGAAYMAQFNAAFKIPNSEPFPFCPTCHIMSVFGSPISAAVNEYYHQVFELSCSASGFLMKNETLLANQPPQPIVADYYNCYHSFNSIFLSSIGIAAGTTKSLGPLVLFALAPIIFYGLKYAGYHPQKAEYTKAECESALQELAIQILRARDGKSRGLRKRGAIERLALDLLRAAEVNEGRDSDDDSDNDVDIETKPEKSTLPSRRSSKIRTNHSVSQDSTQAEASRNLEETQFASLNPMQEDREVTLVGTVRPKASETTMNPSASITHRRQEPVTLEMSNNPRSLASDDLPL